MILSETTLWPVLSLVILGAVMYISYLTNRGFVYNLRPIAGLDAVDEAIGRAVEMGTPVLVSLGRRPIQDKDSPPALPLLSYVARNCAKLGAELIACTCTPDMQPIAEAIIFEAYKMEGEEERFNPEMVRFLSPNAYAYTIGMVGIVEREKVSATFLFGGYGGEPLILSEAAKLRGSMVLSINASTGQVYVLLISADYAVIGEEYYTASAILGGDISSKNSILTTDIFKVITLGYIVISMLLKMMGV